MSTQIFISYTKEKNLWNAIATFQQHLQSELRRKSGEKNLTVFFDENLSTGQNWNDELVRELASSKCLIVFLSPLWLNSDYFLKEYFEFKKIDNGKRPVVPILWDEIVRPEFLEDKQTKLLNELNQLQKSDWTLLQYENWDSPTRQLKLAELVKQIIRLL